ncbi:MAG: ABC transporter permease [Tannerellaceae bacterium]|jgi:lipoprotein-releasing system permease protein|nr:ABC transporter permease [Tannerellaceae bacterium]
MPVEFFIARRIYRSRSGDGRRQTPPAVRLAMAGIALGLAVMILSVAIIVGFKKEVRNKVIGFGSHIQVTAFDSNTSYETAPIAIDSSLVETIRSHSGVRHVEAFATKPGILKTETDFQGIVLKGVDEDYDWTFFRNNLKEGAPLTIDPDKTSADVIISRYIARLLKLKMGDTFLTYFVQDDVRVRRFTIVGIYETGFGDYDRLFVLTDIKQIRRLGGWQPNQASGLEIQVNDYDRVDEIADELFSEVAAGGDTAEYSLFIRSIKDMNPMIFSWLDVLDINVAVILILMLAVAGFTMISGLLVVILERIQMIGILKAMGHSNAGIKKVFLYISFFLIGRGMLWGNLIGVFICAAQRWGRVFRLDPSTYYLDAVPIDLSLQSLLLLNLATLTLIWLMMLGPCHLITKISPSRSIRFE